MYRKYQIRQQKVEACQFTGSYKSAMEIIRKLSLDYQYHYSEENHKIKNFIITNKKLTRKWTVSKDYYVVTKDQNIVELKSKENFKKKYIRIKLKEILPIKECMEINGNNRGARGQCLKFNGYNEKQIESFIGDELRIGPVSVAGPVKPGMSFIKPDGKQQYLRAGSYVVKSYRGSVEGIYTKEEFEDKFLTIVEVKPAGC
jgi:hypothetical protein